MPGELTRVNSLRVAKSAGPSQQGVQGHRVNETTYKFCPLTSLLWILCYACCYSSSCVVSPTDHTFLHCTLHSILVHSSPPSPALLPSHSMSIPFQGGNSGDVCAFTVNGNMTSKRWYPTSQILPDGRVFIVGGANVYGNIAINTMNTNNPTYEFWPRKAGESKDTGRPRLSTVSHAESPGTRDLSETASGCLFPTVTI